MTCVNDKQLAHHYLSHDTQNKLPIMMTITDKVTRKVKYAKHYSILLDCSRTE